MPIIHHLHREQVIATELEIAWDFIKSPANLNVITPPDMEFEIVSDVPDKMYNGLLIEYRIGVPFLGKQAWLTEIKNIREKTSFVDEQRVGPYKLWLHYHEIAPTNNGVRFLDHVTYLLPFGPLGEIANSIYVSKELNRIFDFRENAMKRILST